MRSLSVMTIGLSLVLGTAVFGQERIAGDGKDSHLMPSEDQRQSEVTTEVSTDGGVTTEAVTMSTLEDLAMAAGCWATVYSEPEFSGDSLTLIGPHELTDLRLSPGSDWTGDIRSVEVGPGASLKLYADKYFSNLVHDMKAEMALSEFSSRSFGNAIESARLLCDLENFELDQEDIGEEQGLD